MIQFVLLLCCALAPGAFLLHYFYVRDKYPREPLQLVLRIFFLSFFAVIPAVLLELPLGFLFLGPPAGFLVGLIEEGMKLAFIRWLVFRRPELDEPYDLILFSVTVGLGFATAENLLFVLGSGSFTIAIFRGLLSVPAHCLYGVIMGSYLSRWKSETDLGEKRWLLICSFAIPAFLHGLFDFSVLAGPATSNISLLGVVVVQGGWLIARGMVRTAQAKSTFMRPSPLFFPLAATNSALQVRKKP